METYKFFAKEPIKAIEDVILYKAIPLALKRLADELQRKNITIPSQNILDNIPSLVYDGMYLLRNNNEENRQIYELSHGCILAAFLNFLTPTFQYEVFYPEDKSYDILITGLPVGKKPDFDVPNNKDRKEIYKDAFILKVEFTEAKSSDDILSVITNKASANHDYKGRALLVSMDFDGYFDFQKIAKELSQIKQNNFHSISIMGRPRIPTDHQEFYYSFIEVMEDKKVVYPIFKLSLDWARINQKVNQAITQYL